MARQPPVERFPNLRRIEAALVERGFYKYAGNREGCEERGALAISVWTGHSQTVFLAADEIAAELNIPAHHVTAVGDYINGLIR